MNAVWAALVNGAIVSAALGPAVWIASGWRRGADGTRPRGM